ESAALAFDRIDDAVVENVNSPTDGIESVIPVPTADIHNPLNVAHNPSVVSHRACHAGTVLIWSIVAAQAKYCVCFAAHALAAMLSPTRLKAMTRYSCCDASSRNTPEIPALMK